MIITPGRAAFAIYATGTAICAWQIWRMLERAVEQDCPCSRSELNAGLGLAAVSPVAIAFAVVFAGMLWPSAILVKPIMMIRYRHAPRCRYCNRVKPPEHQYGPANTPEDDTP